MTKFIIGYKLFYISLSDTYEYDLWAAIKYYFLNKI